MSSRQRGHMDSCPMKLAIYSCGPQSHEVKAARNALCEQHTVIEGRVVRRVAAPPPPQIPPPLPATQPLPSLQPSPSPQPSPQPLPQPSTSPVVSGDDDDDESSSSGGSSGKEEEDCLCSSHDMGEQPEVSCSALCPPPSALPSALRPPPSALRPASCLAQCPAAACRR